MLNSLVSIAPLQNRFAPLPFKLHLAFCIVATILFLFLFLKNKRYSDLYWMLICDSTLILQFYGDPVTAVAVGLVSVILLVLIALETAKENKAKKAEALKKAEEEKSGDDEIEELDKLVKSERKAIINEKIDVIADAFDGEDAVK